MPEHVWWTLRCKTPDCPKSIAVKYVGIHTGQPIYLLPDNMPGHFDIRCDDCSKIHTYTRQELAIAKVPDSPPQNWVDMI
jgi:hypothetical protein